MRNNTGLAAAPDLPALAAVRRLYAAGRYLDAFEAGRSLGDLRGWAGVEGQLAAGRLAGALGGARLQVAIHLRLGRRHPEHGAAALFHAYALLASRGPWMAWRAMASHGEPREGAWLQAWPHVRADWRAARARVLAAFRDFPAADREIAAALAMSPGRAWLHVEHAGLLEAEDRYDASLEAAQRALALKPNHRPAIQAAAHALVLVDRPEDAVALLEDRVERLQCAALWWQLAGLYREREAHDREDEALERAVALMPLMDRTMRKAIVARRSDTAYARGDLATAATLAREAGGHFFTRIAERLATPPRDRRRAVLNIPFVRQHHLTCAPATLSAIARYWGKPVDHLEVAEAICYDGTPWHAERAWAQQQGYETREFKVTFEAAAALVDRGVPFALSTVEASNAHLQAVIGYDRARHTVLLRDPYVPHVLEMLGEGLQERYGPTGPRGLVLLPAEHAARLAGLDLPDAALYDAHHAFNTALLRHDRQEATAILDRARQDAPDHPLTWMMTEALAGYDGDPVLALRAVETLLERFADNEPLLMRRFLILMRLDRRADALAHLETVAAAEQRDPVFRERLAEALAEDARNAPRVRSILRRLTRQRAASARIYFTLAGTLWTDPAGRDEARDLFRFASTLEDKNEQYARADFTAQQCAGQTQAALEALSQRAQEYGDKSPGPTLTRFEALKRAGRLKEALDALEAGIALRPNDPDLLLPAAIEYALRRNTARAHALLTQAEPVARRGTWLRAAALIDEYEAQLPAALARWQKLAQDEPLNLEAQERAAQLLADLHRPEAAVAALDAACERFPHYTPLHELLYQRLCSSDPARAEAVLRRVVAMNPTNAWAVRELGFYLASRSRDAEAAAVLDTAAALAPRDPATLHLRATIALLRADRDAARQAYRRAIEADADNEHAIERLLAGCDTAQQRTEAARFITDQFARQTLLGGGILAFQRATAGSLPVKEILEVLTTCHRVRPDLWQAWAALVEQQVLMNRLDDAAALAGEAVGRFPLHPPMWLAKATVHRARLEREAERDALREAIRLAPHYEVAVWRLLDARVAEAAFDEAIAVVDEALKHDPRNPRYHSRRAELLWIADRHDEALAAAEQTLAMEPGSEWLWPRYAHWCERLGRPEQAAALAGQLADARAGDAQLRLIQARLLHRPEDLQRCLEAVDHALAIDPRLDEAHDLRAMVLARLHRFDEALAACRPAVYGGAPPTALRGRAAWVLAERGDRAEAIRRIQKLLADAPAYEWGWHQLATWARQAQNAKLYTMAAERLVTLAPHDAEPLGLAGDACEALAASVPRAEARSLLRQAREHYQRAMELDPTQTFCGVALLHLFLDEQQIDEARKVLERLRPHLYLDHALAHQIQIDAAAGAFDDVLTALDELTIAPGDDPAPLAVAQRALQQHLPAGQMRAAIRRMSRLAKQEQATTRSAEMLLRLLADRGRWRQAVRLVEQMRRRPDVWAVLMSTCLNLLADHPRKLRRAVALVRRHRARIADTSSAAADELWAAAGYVAAKAGKHRLVLQVIGDWRHRQHVGQWTLVNFLNSLHVLRRLEEAKAVEQAALALPPDACYHHLLIWAALRGVRERERARVAQLLEPVRADALEGYYRFLYCCARAVVVAGEGDDAQAAVRQGRKLLRAARVTHFPQWFGDRPARDLFAMARVRVEERGGGARLLLARTRARFYRFLPHRH